MTSTIHLRGDALPSLIALTRRLDPSDRPRCVVIAVDLSEVTLRRDAKRLLRDAFEAGLETVKRSPAVRHVVLVTAGEPTRGLHVERVASSILTRAHASLEQSAARDVEFTWLDVTTCHDPELLAGRIIERAESRGSSHGAVVLSWADITGQSIAAADGAH